QITRLSGTSPRRPALREMQLPLVLTGCISLLQMKAFIKAMHCREYPFLINPPRVCAGKVNTGPEAPMLLMAIKSQVGNLKTAGHPRNMGEKWLGERRAGGVVGLVRTVFLLGRQDPITGPHPDLGGLLMLESQKYGDILQWNFKDTFFNLTLKRSAGFWQWASEPLSRDTVCLQSSVLLVHKRSPKEMLLLWRRLQTPPSPC
uniref:Hexosyltransferase n=1 Tax=Esox lucius TaxID=8010 RepID=A0AAY5JYQ5_ESOLU